MTHSSRERLTAWRCWGLFVKGAKLFLEILLLAKVFILKLKDDWNYAGGSAVGLRWSPEKQGRNDQNATATCCNTACHAVLVVSNPGSCKELKPLQPLCLKKNEGGSDANGSRTVWVQYALFHCLDMHWMCKQQAKVRSDLGNKAVEI